MFCSKKAKNTIEHSEIICHQKFLKMTFFELKIEQMDNGFVLGRQNDPEIFIKIEARCFHAFTNLSDSCFLKKFNLSDLDRFPKATAACYVIRAQSIVSRHFSLDTGEYLDDQFPYVRSLASH
jgi:hypothetical protein